MGLVLGGFLTEFADWRWCLLVNVFFVVVGLVGGFFALNESRSEGENRYDILGTVVVTAGLGSLVYGFSLAEQGWGSPLTITFLAVGVVLLALFVWIESRVAQPLLPLRILTDRARAGAFLIQAVAGSVMIGATLYLTFHLQLVWGMSAFVAGVASLPLPLGIMVTAPLVTRLLPRVGPRPLMTAGPLVAAAALVSLSFITPDGDYWVQVFAPVLVMGVGMAFMLVPLQNVALLGVAPHDAGAASAVVRLGDADRRLDRPVDLHGALRRVARRPRHHAGAPPADRRLRRDLHRRRRRHGRRGGDRLHDDPRNPWPADAGTGGTGPLARGLSAPDPRGHRARGSSRRSRLREVGWPAPQPRRRVRARGPRSRVRRGCGRPACR